MRGAFPEPKTHGPRTILLAFAGAFALAVVSAAQQPPPQTPLLREARPGEIWITAPTIGAVPTAPAPTPRLTNVTNDTTPPTAPGSLTVELNGLFRIIARWTAASDPESGIDYYAFALGTGTTPGTESDVRYWQSTGLTTSATISMALTEGATYYLSVRANNGANLSSTVVHSAPLVPARLTYGVSGSAMTYTITPTGFDTNGAVIATWTAARVAEISDFMNKMLPVLKDLYGPPSTGYDVKLVRDQRYVTSAIFFPSTDEIHVGDSVTYQLLTHEMIHALRRDRVLSSGNVWQYDPTLSGFEEGFAQAVSYDAMTEFARRYPSFGLSQKIYGSSHEWDYDFQNVPQLRTTDFWSDTGGMNLHYMRYEVAAAAVAKMELEHPGFYKAFNAQYYSRLNANPALTSSRALIKDIMQTVAPTLEGRAASDWIDRQYVFVCADVPGKKIWVRTQHYPATDYFVFNYVHVYETFSNGSDWAIPLSGGGYKFYGLNGSTGTGTLRNSAGTVVWQQAQQISPVENPPAYYGFGSDEVHLTTQATNQPWPGGDATKFVTSLLPLDLYSLTEQFTAASSLVTTTVYRVMGAPLRRTSGVFGGVAGANGGRILLHHRQYNTTQRVTLTNAAFWVEAPWASLDHPATQSNDSVPGLVDVVYVDAAGTTYPDVRAIGFGNSNGNQLFLFDVSQVPAADVAPLVVTPPQDQQIVVGGAVSLTAAGDGSGTMTYQWQRQPAGSGSFANVSSGGAYIGATTASLSVNTAAGMSGDKFRCVITNHVGATTTSSATLTLVLGVAVTSPPAAVTVAAGHSASFTVGAVGSGTVTYQWQRRAAGASSYGGVSNGGYYAGATTATLTVSTTAAMSGDEFRCVVSDTTGSVTSAAAPLTVAEPPAFTAHPSQASVSAGATATFTISTSSAVAVTYQWQRRPSGSSSFGALADDGGNYAGVTSATLSVAATVAMSGDQFRCVATNLAGSVTSGTAALTVVAAPSITTEPADQSVAAGLQAQFNLVAAGTGPMTYRWQRQAAGGTTVLDIAADATYAGSASSILTLAVSAALSGDRFRCVVTNAAGSATSAWATLTVLLAPAITSQPSSQTATAGGPATFTLVASGSAPLSYRWQRAPVGLTTVEDLSEGGAYAGVTSATLTLTTAVAMSGDQFHCIVTNAGGSVTSDWVVLTVLTAPSAPVITGQPVDQIVVVGGNPRFVVLVTGTAPITYQWQRRPVGTAAFTDLAGGGNYAGTASRELGVTSDLPFSGQQFRCVVSNSVGSITTNVVTLTVGSIPAITRQPASVAGLAGQNAVFGILATGSPAPAYEWQRSTNGGVDWSTIIDSGGFSGASMATLTVVKAPLALDGTRVRARVVNALGSAVSSAATLTVSYAGSVTPSALIFGANRAADGSFTATGRQDVAVEFSGVPAAWTVSADQPWVHITATTGTGAGRFGVTVGDPGPSASGPQIALVSIAVPSAANSPMKMPITMSIVPAPLNAAPFGAVDTPLDNAGGLTGSIAVTGWALDDVEVTKVRIVREPVAGEPAGVPVYLGDASLVEGARPDITGGFGALPRNTRGGWGYLLLTNMLPNQGNGTYTLNVYADDADGHATLLGTRTISCDNLMATAPFGAIDTPAQGETVSGVVNNFGWVLSPGVRRADPLGGGSVTVFIDNVPVGSPSGWVARADLTQLFPSARYSGVAHALAVFTFDSTTLANGVHTISWVVTDNMGEAAGIGSRYFTVANGGGLRIRP